jgi:cytochrome c553
MKLALFAWLASCTLGVLLPEAARAADSPETLYILHCSGCHGMDGQGERRADVPPLPPYVGNFLRDPQGRLYIANVGGVISSGLSDQDTAVVLNWLLERFGESKALDPADRFDAAEIRKLRAQRVADSVGLRRTIASRLKKQGLSCQTTPGLERPAGARINSACLNEIRSSNVQRTSTSAQDTAMSEIAMSPPAHCGTRRT